MLMNNENILEKTRKIDRYVLIESIDFFLIEK